MTSVCAWVTLAAVAVGFLKKWCFPFLREGLCALLTGLLELTNGLTAVRSMDNGLRFLWSALFISFGGISVLLQISAILSQAGLRMKQCIAQKAVHGVISTALAALLLGFGGIVLSLIPMLLFAKLAVEIPRAMVYNGPRKEGI
jgi:MFS-type transporter involved in bile tolerance (Atg22 family)